MYRKILIFTMLTFLFICLVTFTSTVRIAKTKPGIIRVPDDYQKIQWAVGNVSAGDTIIVAAGTYYEHISINKPLSLIGENTATTIVDGGGEGNIIEIRSDNVTVQGFTIQNGAQGISIVSASYANINSNLIKNTSYAAIRVDYSNNNTISNNVIKENDFIGIYVFWYSENNTISSNHVSSNEVGIEVGADSSGNVISNNIITNNFWEGILLHGACNYNKICNNSISFNGYGVKFEWGPMPEDQPTGNIVYYNTYIK